MGVLIEIKINPAQLELELGLSLAKECLDISSIENWHAVALHLTLQDVLGGGEGHGVHGGVALEYNFFCL